MHIVKSFFCWLADQGEGAVIAFTIFLMFGIFVLPSILSIAF